MSEIEKNVTEDEKLNTSNIFDEFEVDEKLIDEDEKEKVKKDWIYYIKTIWNFLVYVNLILFLVVVSLFSYVYIETSDSDLFDSHGYLNPVCDFLNWEDTSFLWDCSWLSYSIKKIDSLNKQGNEANLEKVVDVLKKSYTINSIKNSKEAIFIIDKSKNKNDPIKILNEFDILKNEFTYDKDRIKCENIIIEADILEANCSSFSAAWYKKIPWLNWEKTIHTLHWTSVTLASSFINYISKHPKFSVIDRQKMFEIVPYFGEWNFVYKTNFKIKIKYSNVNDLSL